MKRGHTLLEMIVVMTVGATLLGIAVCLMHLLMRAEQSGRTHADRYATIARLADQFREDVHAAAGRPAAEGQTAWRLELAPDRTVRYAADSGEIAREERAGEKIVSREFYKMPDEYTASIAPDDAANPALVSLVVVLDSGSISKHREIRIDAAWGKDRRTEALKKEGPSK
jgi:prepilin-type N-terminal cleavage/methylation domain-containing protein